ncbi:MAG: hypothetical protein JXC32_19175 [Anaerolineae bacterium]|nr:hypothetical protein [Anaerolineae bacterium]
MSRFKKAIWLFVTVALLATTAVTPAVAAPAVQGRDDGADPDYIEAIEKTAAMVWDPQAQRLVEKYGLNIINVTWEDTGRYYDSSVGPNISDVTIQVQHKNPRTGDYELTLMPVIRYPNFTDLTADISPDDFYLLVGNEAGGALQRVTLTEYLSQLPRYLSDPDSWEGDEVSLMSRRDTHVLVSAQAAFLPVPEEGKAEFNPVIFNYQSYQGDPAVLTIVATREGTSATIIDNVRDAFPAGFSWGQRLFFNQNGERASFTGERLSDFVPEEQPGREDPSADEQTPEAAGEEGLNMVLLIQVPLKQKHPMRGFVEEEGLAYGMAPAAAEKAADERSDVEAAVIGHGEVEGPFTEIDDLKIERDPDFPIRVTVQFYKATSNGVISEADVEAIADQIRRVYDEADYVGSLVVDGPSDRPTEYDGSKVEPDDWWEVFWRRFEQNTGMDREDAYRLWRRLGIKAWQWWPLPKPRWLDDQVH